MPGSDPVKTSSGMKKLPIVLTIAGSDNSGGAGIQADIKTCSAFKIYAASVITGITAQNSKHVYGIEPVSMKMLEMQIDSIFEVMAPDAIKIGMLPTSDCISLVSEKLRKYNPKHIVVDPVMVATNGDSLIKGDGVLKEMKRSLLPLATLVTPNKKEATALLGEPVDRLSPEVASINLKDICCSGAILLKGGDFNGEESIDYLYDGKNLKSFSSKRIDTPNTHGTGCTLSSAIACELAKGNSLVKAVQIAKDYITNAIKKGKEYNIMEGRGPLYFFS